MSKGEEDLKKNCDDEDNLSFHKLGIKLRKYLCDGEEFEINHIRSERYEIDSLYWGPLSKQEEDGEQENKVKTTQEENLIFISHDGIQLYGIEVINYQILVDDKCLRTVTFVSKADTTGYYKKQNNIRWGPITTEIVEYAIGLALENQSQSLKDIQSQLCIFARSEPQYIFPGSSFNEDKHILSGAGLVRWWCKAVDRICHVDNVFQDIDKVRLTIPGADRFTIKSLMPKGDDWKPGDIFAPESAQDFSIWKALNGNDDKKKEIHPLAIDFIPAFPDDPKNRFLNDILATSRMDRTSIDRFWIEMAARQEFLLGELTAVIGVEGHYNRDQQVIATTKDANFISHEVYNQLWTCLMDADYSTREKAQENCARFNKFVQDKGNGWYGHCTIQGNAAASNLDEIKSSSTTAKRQVTEINVLQVRKKPKRANASKAQAARQQLD